MLDKAIALEQLRRQRDAVDGIPPNMSAPEFIKWKRDTRVAIANIFGEQARHVKEFDSIFLFISGTSQSVLSDACRDGLRHAKSTLQSMVDEIKDYWQDQEHVGGVGPHPDSARTLLETHPNSPEVFVVHGHDEAMKQSVCRTPRTSWSETDYLA
jgi:hypothetical protein